MTALRQRHRAAFTLIEMMIVIGIILVLAAMVYPATIMVITAANKAHARHLVEQLNVAAAGYRNEYHRMPRPRSAVELVLIFNGLRDPVSVQDASGSALLAENPRKIKFMEFKTKDVINSPTQQSTGPLHDRWGTPFAYAFDNGVGGEYFARGGWPQSGVRWPDPTSDDNILPAPFSISGKPDLIDTACAFFSNGPDQRTGTVPSRPGSQTPAYEDDIRSW
jgi:prepilin-type N-terminal cleavage/methylation domain-containing protein